MMHHYKYNCTGVAGTGCAQLLGYLGYSEMKNIKLGHTVNPVCEHLTMFAYYWPLSNLFTYIQLVILLTFITKKTSEDALWTSDQHCLYSVFLTKALCTPWRLSKDNTFFFYL